MSAASAFPSLRSLAISADGNPLALRLLLPPNLGAVAARGGRIAVRLEFAPGQRAGTAENANGSGTNAGGMAAESLPNGTWLLEPGAFLAALLIESWCEGRLPLLLHLDADQLRQLLAPLQGCACVFWLRQPSAPLLWHGATLNGVHDSLPAPTPAARAEVAAQGNAGTQKRHSTTRDGATAKASSRLVAGGGFAAAGASASDAAEPTAAALPPMEPHLTPLEVDGSPNFLALRMPSRESALYRPALELVREWGFSLEPSNGRWWLRDRHKTLQFLADCGETLREGYRAAFTENFIERTSHLIAARAAYAVHASGARGSTDFELELSLDAAGAPAAAVDAALARGLHYVELPSAPVAATATTAAQRNRGEARVVLLPASVRTRLHRAQNALGAAPSAQASPLRSHLRRKIGKAEVAATQSILNELDAGAADATRHAAARLPAQWRELGRALDDTATLPACPQPAAFNAALRPYQRVGAAWLWHLYRHGLGGILADEMGLGKTVQCLAFLCAALEQDGGPALVVCPASLVENWRREAARFAPHLKVFVHHGSSRLANDAGAGAFDLILTSYGTLARDAALFAAVPLRLAIADEAQHIKNARSQNARALRSLNAQGRFLLTGTPVENDLAELQSLFAFLLPGYLGAPAAARNSAAGNGTGGGGANGGNSAVQRQEQRQHLIRRAAPYILRRMKRNVATDLPEKIEQTIYCDFGPQQRAFYNRVQEAARRAVFELEMANASQARQRIAAFNELLRLRQTCIDPRLLGAAAQTNPDTDAGTDAGGESAAAAATSGARQTPWAEATPDEKTAQVANEQAVPSAKREALLELLDEAIGGGHRVLVFSQFTAALRLVAEDLDAQGISYYYLDGQTRGRTELCARFNADETVKVFLISLRAGGTGLNLTGADTVVHLDPWWNPAVQAQASDRAHRIGQTNVVTVYELIATDSVEERVLTLRREKAALLEELLEHSDAATASVGLADLKELLGAKG